MAAVQFTPGVSVLLLAVPVWLGALHQAGALLLFGLSLWAIHRLRPGFGPRQMVSGESGVPE